MGHLNKFIIMIYLLRVRPTVRLHLYLHLDIYIYLCLFGSSLPPVVCRKAIRFILLFQYFLFFFIYIYN